MTQTTPKAAREAETPWYHGLKLIADDFCTVDGYKTRISGPYRFGNPRTSRTICTIHADFDRSAPKDPYNLSFKRAEQFAALFAAAPETATERDALKAKVAELTAQNERQREALKAIMHAVCGETGLVWVPWD